MQQTIQKIKVNREMGERFMIWEEFVDDIMGEEFSDIILEFLEELGPVPEKVLSMIETERDNGILKRWLKIAGKVDSIEQFVENM